MANTQTTVPIFVAAQVLEANQLNQSAATGVPVFATTVTRDAGFGGAGEKPLAEGQLCYLESTNVVQYYDGAAWATVGPAAAPAASGLSFIAKATFTAVANVNILNCFSASYTHYSLRLSNFSGGGVTTLRFGTAGTPDTGLFYQNSNIYVDSSSIAGGSNANYNASSANLIGNGYATPGNTLFAEFSSPFETVGTTYVSQGAGSFTAGSLIIGTLNQGRVNTSTSYTDLQIINGAGSMSGTYSIYGYAQS
jgi:hypothetical protein